VILLLLLEQRCLTFWQLANFWVC